MSERLDAIVADAVAALHGVLEKHQVTEAEWHAALRFLTDIGRADEFILLSDVTRTSVLVDALTHTTAGADIMRGTTLAPDFAELALECGCQSADRVASVS